MTNVEAFLHLMFWLLVAHAVCDMPLQPEGLHKMKRRKLPDGAHGRWIVGLTCHALIHAGGVAMVTGSVTLGVMEFVAHWAIDAGKCEAWYGMGADQSAHLACKVVWACIATVMLMGGN